MRISKNYVNKEKITNEINNIIGRMSVLLIVTTHSIAYGVQSFNAAFKEALH